MGFCVRTVRSEEMSTVDELRLRANGSSGEFLNYPTNHLLVAVVGSEVAGTVGLEYHGEYAVLRDLFVVKGYRRQGIGTALVRRCFEVCIEDGIEGLYLLTYFWNIKRFFGALGFRLFRRRQGLPKEILDSWQFHLKGFNRCVSLGIELNVEVSLRAVGGFFFLRLVLTP